MPNLTSLRCRRPAPTLDPAREPLLRAAREGVPGVLPPMLEAARASGRSITPAAVLEAAEVDELEARAIAGLMLARTAPDDTWRAGSAHPPRLRLQVLQPPEAIKVVIAQRQPLGPGDLHWFGLTSWGNPLPWAAARTHAGLVDQSFIGMWIETVNAAFDPGPLERAGHLRHELRESGASDLRRALEDAGALQGSPSPIAAPSLTSIAQIDRVVRQVRASQPVLIQPLPRAVATDLLTLAWAEGQRASLLAGAERIAHELVHLEARLERLCACIVQQERLAEVGGPAPCAETIEARHALLAAIGVARATHEEKCELAASFCTLQVDASDSPLEHLYAAEFAMLVRQHEVRARHLAAGRPESLANRLMYADPERKRLLGVLRGKQEAVQRELDAVNDRFGSGMREALGWRIKVGGTWFDASTLGKWRHAVARVSLYAD